MAHLNAEQILCFFKGLTLFFMYGPDSTGLYEDEVQIFVASLNKQVKWVPSITPIRIIPKINYLSGTMNLLCFVIWKPFLEQVTHCLGLSVFFLVNWLKSRNREGVHILDVPIMMAQCSYAFNVVIRNSQVLKNLMIYFRDTGCPYMFIFSIDKILYMNFCTGHPI